MVILDVKYCNLNIAGGGLQPPPPPTPTPLVCGKRHMHEAMVDFVCTVNK